MDTKALNIEVLFENKDLLVINKPAGLLVHGIFNKEGAMHNEPTLVDWLTEKYPETVDVGDTSEEGIVKQQRGGIVHRLDRETSGVLVIARNQETFLYLKKLFQEKKVQKTYIALVWGHVKEQSGVINKPISIKDGSVKRTVFKGKMPREAITSYKVIKFVKSESGEEFTLLEVMPKTGRTHQIRVHLSSIGHPVVGDKLYGKHSDLHGLNRHFLHAAKIEFNLPTGKSLTVEAPLPESLEKLLSALK